MNEKEGACSSSTAGSCAANGALQLAREAAGEAVALPCCPTAGASRLLPPSSAGEAGWHRAAVMAGISQSGEAACAGAAACPGAVSQAPPTRLNRAAAAGDTSSGSTVMRPGGEAPAFTPAAAPSSSLPRLRRGVRLVVLPFSQRCRFRAEVLGLGEQYSMGLQEALQQGLAAGLGLAPQPLPALLLLLLLQNSCRAQRSQAGVRASSDPPLLVLRATGLAVQLLDSLLLLLT